MWDRGVDTMYGKTEQHIGHMLKGLSWFCLNCYKNFNTLEAMRKHELDNGYDHEAVCRKLFAKYK